MSDSPTMLSISSSYILYNKPTEKSIFFLQTSTGGILVLQTSTGGILVLQTSTGGIALQISTKSILTLQTSIGGILASHISTGGRPALQTSARGIIQTISLQGNMMLFHGLSDIKLILRRHDKSVKYIQLGGHRTRSIVYTDIAPYIENNVPIFSDSTFNFVDHIKGIEIDQYSDIHYLITNIPIHIIIPYLPLSIGCRIARLHDIEIQYPTISILQQCFKNHICKNNCLGYRSILSIDNNLKRERRKDSTKRMQLHREKKNKNKPKISDIYKESFDDIFPPEPLNKELACMIVKSACDAMDSREIEEGGCAVCGQLVPLSTLSRLSAMSKYLHVLSTPGVTRKERLSKFDKIYEYPTVLDHSCDHICNSCRAAIRNNKVPRFALAKGLWLGNVPKELSSLRYVERMLIARIRHSCCCIRIASGMQKMKANVIAFQSPIPKIYNILPPPKDEIQDILAIMFTGPFKPTASDFKRTPFLVRRNNVKKALEWLSLNHQDYENIIISDENLQQYPEDMPPVSIEYKNSSTNKTPEGTSLFDFDEEDGTAEGECPFTVHGLTGHELDTMTTNAIKAKALQHLNSGGKMLAIGHAEQPESIWNNPHLYPQMFPWLFPYGLGGIGTVKGISDQEHKRHLLMYHDKRFQTDPTFPFVAFSHEQIKASTSQSFLLADKGLFKDITNRLLSLNVHAINCLIDRLTKDGDGKPQNEEEKKCYQIIKDLDHVQWNIKGSNTSKKRMRNQIWSLINHCGAPFWYITLSPADVKHPICLYYANTNESFTPNLMKYEERLRLICRNPVAGARFFHFVVNVFINCILGVNAKHRGLYGKTKAYYGTVEQQGRLTLHLHILLWLMGNLTPQEMRNKILDPNSEFQKKIITWIESCQVGEFLTGTQQEVLENHLTENVDYKDPTETMPIPPPEACQKTHVSKDDCTSCLNIEKWWSQFEQTVDDLVSKSNIHSCERGTNKDGSRKHNLTYVGCKDNKYGKCRARFPRPTFENTHVDLETGSINIKKKEQWINSITPVLTYIFRCNTDVTCMWSGTALKAVVLYISDYITKTGLKTHVVFDAIKSIFEKNQDILDCNTSEKEKARRLMNKMVNLLSTKQEMGAPMICMYLLGHPDHYTSHSFVSFFWKTYVNEVYHAWCPDNNEIKPTKVTLLKCNKNIIGVSQVDDYIYRPTDIENMCLYDWIRCCKRKRLPSKKIHPKKNNTNITHDTQTTMEYEDNHNDCQDSDDGSQTESISNDENPDVDVPIPKSMYKFLKSHPLYDSHGTIIKQDNPNIVADFIGNLPRSDQGDREYYCLTMLVLFKPWREPLNLKIQKNTWNETFLKHKFTNRQLELMKNFNIKYECLDARDDYNAQMRNSDDNTFFPYGTEIENEKDDFDPDLFTKSNDFDDIYNYDTMMTQPIGRSEYKRQREAEEIRNILHNTGWSKTVKSNLDANRIKPYLPEYMLPASEWKAKVQSLKQNAIGTRQESNKNANSASSNVYKIYNLIDVKIIDKSYLEKRFYNTEHEVLIGNIAQKFLLNIEQKRAFDIVAHHVVMPHSEQLKMYIGGIGGTGKSRVIDALSHYFTIRSESFRFIIVAPTGSAAALLGGSTYHSVLGINEKTGSLSAKKLTEICTQLQGVDYVFLDEVSMLSALDLYKISAQLCRIMNKPDIPFGGMNMIFAGDFGQLPPPMGAENVSLYSRTIGKHSTSLKSQEEAMGRSLWHQVTTVVILRKNMRQLKKSAKDDKFRKCLNNMRFKDCSVEDIQFLRSCVTSLHCQKASICDDKFRNVSIITAKNAQKDEINRIGCMRFSEETDQQLTHFYSDDSKKDANDEKIEKKKKGKYRTVSSLSTTLQKLLWELPHSSATKHIPGKLSLCIGLPVIIKCNAATELCITNGQEAIVLGWQSKLGSSGQLMLDTLFVELNNPPKIVKIDGLKENVVPITCTTNTITCSLPDDTKITISRTQVEILPNFAMTDFASQGKTRPYNPIDLNNCRSHQAYYTALSRSATAEGTIILQGFDAKKITGCASGALRQEFRELELLDEITKLHYENKLQTTIFGDRRNDIIYSYRLHKGLEYVPSTVHDSIKWNKSDPMLDSIDTNVDWKILSVKTFNQNISLSLEKHSIEEYDSKFIDQKRKRKKRKLENEMIIDTTTDTPSMNHLTPIGLAWNQNSCAYDSILSIIHFLWLVNKPVWNSWIRQINNLHLRELCLDFEKIDYNIETLPSARDKLRHRLQQISNDKFPWGGFTSIEDILHYILETNSTTFNSFFNCPHFTGYTEIQNTTCLITAETTRLHSIGNWINNIRELYRCNMCQGNIQTVTKMSQNIPILAFHFAGHKPFIDPVFNVNINEQNITYVLNGVIYFGHYHFTSRIINKSGLIWFHDGITTGNDVIYEGTLNNINLSVCKEKYASAAIYSIKY